MVRTKVFVGNLSFKTREAGLLQAFQTAGNVVQAQIVTRGAHGRSLGYGFVEYESEDGANKAIKELNKTLLDEREVNVEMARPRQEGAPPARRNNFRPRFNPGGFRPRGYQTGYYPRGQLRGQGRGAPMNGPHGGPRNNRRPRPPKKTPEERNLQPSPTSLFVTNLPFKFTDADFMKVFTDKEFKPKSVKIATRYNGRSRGYGFADFENTEQQQKAMAAVDKTIVDSRELVVKVAYVEPVKPNQPAPGQAPAQAPAQVKQEAPKQEAPKQEAPKQAAPAKQEAPKQEAPKQEAPKQEAPKAAPAKQEAPKQEAPKQEAPKQEAPKQAAPAKQDAPKQEGGKKQPPKKK